MNARTPDSTASTMALLVALCAASAWGCRSEREGLDAAPTGPGACAGTCHGDHASPAPPFDVDGNVDSRFPGVGAHAAHLTVTSTHVAVACASCHLVPSKTGDPGHADDARPAELAFSGRALEGGRAPAYDATTGTCSNTYCHAGATTAVSWPNEAVWTQPRDSKNACGSSCHATPPGGSHPASKSCELCHSETAGPGLTIVSAANHIDGKVQFSPQGCTACHGSDENAAPPLDLAGASDASLVTVGAHQSHLSGGEHSRPVECAECHVVPASIGAPGHTDGDGIAELVFGGVAVAAGENPMWNRPEATCSATYCHGSESLGGMHVEPTWTNVGGLEAKCGSCHGLPPPRPHVANLACDQCHTETAGPGATIADRFLHVNGTLDIPGGPCNQCHGDATSSAPPRDLAGNTTTAAPGVGAHRRHLDASEMTISTPLSCDACHELPPISGSHMSGTTDLVFSGIALGTVPGAPVGHQTTPSYSTATRQCSNVYCHGGWIEAGNPSGGASIAPIWNQVDGSQVSCGSCHGFPPPAPHPPSTACANCHPAVVNDQLEIVDPSRHVNGQVDFN